MRPGKLVAVFALFARVYVNAACVPRPAVSAAEFVHLPFDFLVIGGGTAGVALSSRLAEDPRLVVGLIEAGDIHLNDPIVDVPSNSPVGNATYDWRFSTIPQVNLGGKIVPVPRGKMLGGSSGINGLAWGRASSVEYDAWSSFASDSSWSWAGLLPFMKKSESFYFPPNNPFPGISKQQAAHALKDLPRVDGFSGPIAASHNTQYFDPVFKMTDTLNEQGIPTNAEPQAGNAIGVINTLRSLNLTEGVRSYAAPTYYCSHANDTNYHVIVNAQATKVHFASHASPFIATGVEFVVGNKAYVATARREVILSAGTVQTPQLLELSGIGNSSVLAQHGIPTLVNLPGVGENLQEHTFATVQWKLQPGVTTFDILRNNATFAEEQQAIYNKTRGGLLAATDAMVAFLTLGDIASPEELDAFLNIFDQEANVASGAPFTRLQNKFRRDWFAKGSAAAVELIHLTRGIINPEANQSYVTVLAGILHPSSKGSIHISSSDALSAPTIDLNLLSSAFDRAVIVQFMKFVQKIGKATPFSDIVNLQTDPDASIQTDEELSSYIDATSSIGDHLIGTAAIGPRDEGGVVDNSLKVYGTANLRVVDASVIPLHIAAHTQATIYAIAEKAADAILKCI